MSLLKREQTASSVSGSKVRTMDAARKRIIAGLKGQKEIWDRDRGEGLPEKKGDKLPDGRIAGPNTPTKSSLWFKKKDLNDDWLLKIKLLQTNIYTSESAKKAKQPFFSVSPDEMSDLMKTTLNEIKEGKWDEYIRMSLEGTKLSLED